MPALDAFRPAMMAARSGRHRGGRSARAKSRAGETERGYRHLFDSNPMPMWIIDPESLRFLEVNEAVSRLYGYSREEFLSMTTRDLRRPQELAAYLDYIRSRDAGRPTVRRRTRHRRKDGSMIEVEVTSHPLNYGGRLARLVLITDVTERARYEAEIGRLNAELERKVAERTRQLELANKELESFAYSVSHDLRAPLRSIEGFSQALVEDYGGLLDDVGRDYLRRVRRAAQRMGDLIEDLLALSRVTRAELAWREVDMSALAADIVQELRRQEPDREVDLAVSPGMSARADPSLLRVALQNLLHNAWKFTGRRRDARIEVGARQEDGRTVYFVRDNGVGFDMTRYDRLFGAFQRLHPESEFPGVGVGLATVQRIIRRHGGEIWARSETGCGATFCFTLGAREPGAEENAAP